MYCPVILKKVALIIIVFFFTIAVNDDHVQQCGMPLMNFKGVGVENKCIVAKRREKSEVNIDIIFLQLMVLKSGSLFSASLGCFFLKSDSERLTSV